MKQSYPYIVKDVLNEFKIDYDYSDNILSFLNECKKNDMLPMILFNTELNNCISLFKNIYESLVEEESKNYPYHYDILEKKNELYMKYYEKCMPELFLTLPELQNYEN